LIVKLYPPRGGHGICVQVLHPDVGVGVSVGVGVGVLVLVTVGVFVGVLVVVLVGVGVIVLVGVTLGVAVLVGVAGGVDGVLQLTALVQVVQLASVLYGEPSSWNGINPFP
jgi:hypothetical protein